MPTSPAAFFPTLRGPEIDESLFVNAAATGVGIGQATPSTTSALVQGGIAGVQLGMSVATGISNLESAAVNREATTVNTEAQRQQNEIGALKNEAIKNNEQAAVQAYENKIKIEAEESRVKLEDVTNSTAITDAIASGSGELIGALLQNPMYAGTLTRNPELARQVIGAGRSRGADPSILDAASNSYDAVETQRVANLQAAAIARANAQYGLKNEQKYIEANGRLQSYGGFVNQINQATQNGQVLDPNNFNVYKKGEVTVNSDGTLLSDASGRVIVNPDAATLKSSPGYVMTYGNKVIDQNIPIDAGTSLREDLEIFKSYNKSQFTPNLIPRPQVSQGVQQGTGQTQMDLTQGIGLDQGLQTNTAELTPAGQTVYNTMQARSEAALKAMGDRGASYIEAMQAAKQNVRQAQSEVGRVPFTNSDQTTTQAANGQLNTQPVTVPTNFNDPFVGLEKISNALGGASVFANFDSSLTRQVGNREVSILNKTVADRIESIPAVANKPALFKGLVAIESGGNPNAVSPAGASGLSQLMPGTASDLGVSPDQVFDPNVNAEAGAEYLEQLDNRILSEFQKRERDYLKSENSINVELAKQSLPQKVDPRITLLAYNGGIKWVIDSIRKGNTTFDDILEDFANVKSPAAYAENSKYPDKVIAASLPLIKGGNASDDDYIQTLIQFGIIGVNFDQPTAPMIEETPNIVEQQIEPTPAPAPVGGSPAPSPLTGEQ